MNKIIPEDLKMRVYNCYVCKHPKSDHMGHDLGLGFFNPCRHKGCSCIDYLASPMEDEDIPDGAYFALMDELGEEVISDEK